MFGGGSGGGGGASSSAATSSPFNVSVGGIGLSTGAIIGIAAAVAVVALVFFALKSK